MRVKRKQRTVVWLVPFKASFEVLFILGEKAMRAARESGLSESVLKILDKAPRYPEGTGVRLEVKTRKDLELPKNLARIKLEN